MQTLPLISVSILLTLNNIEEQIKNSKGGVVFLYEEKMESYCFSATRQCFPVTLGGFLCVFFFTVGYRNVSQLYKISFDLHATIQILKDLMELEIEAISTNLQDLYCLVFICCGL